MRTNGEGRDPALEAARAFNAACAEEALLAQNRIEAAARYCETAWREPPSFLPPAVEAAMRLAPGGRFAAQAMAGGAGAWHAASLMAFAGFLNGAQIAAAAFDAALRPLPGGPGLHTPAPEKPSRAA